MSVRLSDFEGGITKSDNDSIRLDELDDTAAATGLEGLEPTTDTSNVASGSVRLSELDTSETEYQMDQERVNQLPVKEIEKINTEGQYDDILIEKKSAEITRQKILDLKVDEKVKQMNDDEFDRFIDEVEQNDADVYWGATYKE